MKTSSIFTIIFTLLLSIEILSQPSSNWNDIIDLNVDVISDEFADVMDLYVDRDGLHIVVQRSNQLDYYLFSPTGSQIRSSVIDNNVTEDPRLSKIIGYEENVYIVYKENDRIKTRLSTDAGATWSANISEIIMPNPFSNGLNLWANGDGLHLVYSEAPTVSSDPYDTWYQRSEHDDDFWIETYKVTDNPNDAGGLPAITTSPNRVHVVFTDIRDPYPATHSPGDAKTRDRYLGSWQSSMNLFENYAVLSNIVASSSKLHGTYYENDELVFDLYYKNRDFSSPWPSQSTLLLTFAEPWFAPADMTVTEDDRVHMTTGYESYIEWANGTLSESFRYADRGFTSWSRIAANGNDVYVAWLSRDVTPNTIEMRQRDFAPLIPTGVAGSIEDPTGDKHPRLDWNPNREADLSGYEIHKKVGSGSWALLATTANTYYVDETVTGASFQQYSNNVVISYKIRAKDLQNQFSDFSSQVDFNTRGSGQEKPISWKPVDSGVPGEFTLLQNYPNPFNPVTTIQFGLKKAEAAEVVVYSMDGRKIATVVNEFLEAGTYQVQWNGKDAYGNPASSGVYLYQLKAGDQRLVKKMMLIK